jgi:hypothetical protein
MHDVLVPEVVLQCARIAAVLCQLVAGRVSKHVRVDWKWKLRCIAQTREQLPIATDEETQDFEIPADQAGVEACEGKSMIAVGCGET